MSHTFRRRNAQALYDMHYGPNMTPMVDVVMVILIFFMASTAFLGPEWFLKTYLPTRTAAASSAQQPTRVQLVMTRGAEGQTWVSVNGGAAVGMKELEGLLEAEVKRAGAENIVAPIEAAAEVAYEDVVRVHEMCARLGISKVGLN